MKSLFLATTALVALTAAAQAADPIVIKSIPVMPAQDVLAAGLSQTAVAEGADKLENPSKYVGYYGYGTDGPLIAPKGAKPAKDKPPVEATKTEPDKNTYLVLAGQTGPAKGYDYGTHFLFQGHEGGPVDESGIHRGSLTRINLDANLKHRVTLMADMDTSGKPLPLIDGSAWDPFAKVLLLTSETGTSGGVWAATLDFPSKVTDISGATGVPLILAMIAGNDWQGHAPGPNGLPGGYPVALRRGVLDLDLAATISRKEAIAWNARFEAEDGLAVDAAGRARYSGRLYEKLRAVSPSMAEGFDVRDIEPVHREMEALRARLQARPAS